MAGRAGETSASGYGSGWMCHASGASLHRTAGGYPTLVGRPGQGVAGESGPGLSVNPADGSRGRHARLGGVPGIAGRGGGMRAPADASRTPQLTRPQAPGPDPRSWPGGSMAMQPDWPTAAQARLRGRPKCVALTFDDGPGRLHRQAAGTAARPERQGHVLRRRADGRRRRGRPARTPHRGGGPRARQPHAGTIRPLTGLPEPGVCASAEAHDELVRALTGVRMRVMRPPYGATEPPGRRRDAPPGAGADPVERRHPRLAGPGARPRGQARGAGRAGIDRAHARHPPHHRQGRPRPARPARAEGLRR